MLASEDGGTNAPRSRGRNLWPVATVIGLVALLLTLGSPTGNVTADEDRPRIKIIDSESGKALVGVRVHACCVDPDLGALERLEMALVQTSDAQGTIEPAPAQRGPWIYIPVHADYTHPFTNWLGSRVDEKWASQVEDLTAAFDALLLARAKQFGILQPREADSLPHGKISLAKGEAIEIVARDATGTPCAGVKLRLGIPGSPWMLLLFSGGFNGFQHVATTDADGRARLRCVGPGTQGLVLMGTHPRLMARMQGYDLKRDGRSLAFDLVEPAALSGRVLDPRGRPVSGGTKVCVYSKSGYQFEGDQVFSQSRSWKVSDDGTFTLSRVPPGDVELSVWHELWESRDTEISNLQSGEVRGGIELQLHAEGLVRGVLREADGTPLGGELIVVSRGPTGEPSVRERWTKDDGSFRFNVRSAVPVDLWLRTGHRHECLKRGVHPSTEVTEVVGTPTKRMSLRVMLNHNGRYSHSSRVNRSRSVDPSVGDSSPPGAEGTVELLGEPPYFLPFAHLDWDSASESVFPSFVNCINQVVEAGSTWESVILPKRHVYGRVRDESGRLIAGVRLFVGKQDREREVPIDSSGAFAFEVEGVKRPVLEAFRFEVSEGLRTSVDDWGLQLTSFNEVVVYGNRESLTGRVVMREGDNAVPVGGCPLVIRWHEPSEKPTLQTYRCRTSWSGVFEVDALPKSATVEVTIEPDWLRSRLLEIAGGPVTRTTAGTDDLTLTLRQIWVRPKSSDPADGGAGR